MCSRIAARRPSRACETDSSVAACSDAASALLSCSNQLRTFGSASKVISCWIFSGVASLFADAAGFPALGAAAKAADNGAVMRMVAANNAVATRFRAPMVAISLDIAIASLPGANIHQQVRNCDEA